MPAVADLQNTVVKEFADNPRVVTAIMSQQESLATLQEFWRNIYLRSPMIFDQSGATSSGSYSQPPTGLPFSRAVIIGPDQNVVLPYFGHNPQYIIDTIYEVLGLMPALGDVDQDGDVDLNDFATFAGCFGLFAPNPPDCPAEAFGRCDLDGDLNVDLNDYATFATAFTG